MGVSQIYFQPWEVPQILLLLNYTANFNSDHDKVQQLSSQELFESIVINLYPNKVYYF